MIPVTDAYPALLRLTLRCLTCHGGVGVLLGCIFFPPSFFFFWLSVHSGLLYYSVRIAYSFFFLFFFSPFSFFVHVGCVPRLYRLILFFFPPFFFFFWVCSFRAATNRLYIGLFFPPFFWVCSFGAATSIGLFSLQLSLLFLYIHCNIVSFHMTYSYRHMHIPAPTDRQLFTLDFLFGYSTFTHTIIT